MHRMKFFHYFTRISSALIDDKTTLLNKMMALPVTAAPQCSYIFIVQETSLLTYLNIVDKGCSCIDIIGVELNLAHIRYRGTQCSSRYDLRTIDIEIKCVRICIEDYGDIVPCVSSKWLNRRQCASFKDLNVSCIEGYGNRFITNAVVDIRETEVG